MAKRDDSLDQSKLPPYNNLRDQPSCFKCNAVSFFIQELTENINAFIEQADYCNVPAL